MDVSKPTHLRTGRYWRGFLPHLRAEGRPYFVTFRLEGTLPQEVLQQYQAERDALRAQAEQQGYQLSWYDQKRLFELYSAKVEAYLDAGYGNCWLRDTRLADLVCHALRFFDVAESALGRYALGAWVVMPNHVHVIVRPEGQQTLDRILQSWKGYAAREANKILNRTGESFWAREYYDHAIRDDAEKARLTRYIYDNPVKAGLCKGWGDWEWSSAHPRWRSKSQGT